MTKGNEEEKNMNSLELEARLRLSYIEQVNPEEISVSVKKITESEFVIDYLVQSQNSCGRIPFSQLRNDTKHYDIKQSAQEEAKRNLKSFLEELCIEAEKKKMFKAYRTSEKKLRKRLANLHNANSSWSNVLSPYDINLTRVETRADCYRAYRDRAWYTINGREENREMQMPFYVLGLKRRK